jgi:hypothetical protein
LREERSSTHRSPFLLPDAYRYKARLHAWNLFVPNIASAHMLSSLGMGIQVLSYPDDAHVVLNKEGDDWRIGEVILHPTVNLDQRLR